MKECKKCNKTFDDSAIYCPICGDKLEGQVSQKVNTDQYEDTSITDVPSHMNLNEPLPPNKVKIYVIKKKLFIILSLLIAILPFFITGFSFFFTWYILIAFVLFLAYVEYSEGFAIENATERNMGVLNVNLIIIFIIVFIMYIWGPLNPNY